MGGIIVNIVCIGFLIMSVLLLGHLLLIVVLAFLIDSAQRRDKSELIMQLPNGSE